MDTSVGAISPVHQAGPQENQSVKTSRSIAEAKRLLAKNQVTGAKAMRILNMLSVAEQNMGQGNTIQAQRIAREALSAVRDIDENSNPINPNRKEESEAASAPTSNDETEETPANNVLAESESDEPFQRETTSYQDGSDDSGISFQAAQPLTPAQAPFAVRQHELSHVRRETSDAILNGQRVLASVTIHSHIDPTTGQQHIGGGRARVIVFPDMEQKPLQNGNNLDIKA